MSDTVKKLSHRANEYTFNSKIAFRSWVHVCQSILNEAKIYTREGGLRNMELAFVMNLRFADLVINKLPTHSDVNKNSKKYKQLCSLVPEVLKESEQLKRVIIEQYPKNPPVTNVNSNPNPKSVGRSKDVDFEKELENALSSSPVRSTEFPITPSIPKHAPVAAAATAATRGPPLPPQVLIPPKSNTISNDSILNPHPHPHPQTHPQTHAVPPQLKSDPQSVNESTLPLEFEHKSSLRYIFSPQTLRHEFLKHATANTNRNLETCGMLCGKLHRNAFFVTDLVIPRQESTANSCVTTNEEELFDYVDQNDLFLLGWIHTHPTQTCFMSSVDLHTHASYQIMLPESVAVVCSPRYKPDFGVFRLTDPPGMDIIKKCLRQGFHPHEEPNIYENTSKGVNHFYEIDCPLKIKDFRS